jgi:hypothetical protein
MKRGKAVLFGHDKWDFMVTLMLGLQVRERRKRERERERER